MNTFHRIVLALAGSLNNGTSSLAPQGIMALRNKPNALASAFAERQAQTSAKTPPSPNRIGKGIGKFWIPILLATATLLTPSIEQAESQTSSTNVLNLVPVESPPVQQAGGPGPNLFTRLSDGTLQAASYSPTAAPILAAPAAPVIKKGAIIAGTWLVAVALEWGIQGLLDKWAAIEDEKATATVHGARWLSNEYVAVVYSPPGQHQRIHHNYTTTADMGDEHDPASAMGWLGYYPGRSMTQDEAISQLKRMKVEIISEMWVLYDPTYYNPSTREYGFISPSHTVRARKDSFQAEKARKLKQWRKTMNLPGLVYQTLELRDTFKFNVGSFGMFSDFNDPTPILKVLGTADAIDSAANYYEATATWEYRTFQPNGTWGEWKPKRKKFSQETGDGIKSWEDHHFTFDFCKKHQEITDPAIYEGIERFISKRPVMERYRRTGQMRRGGEYGWRRVGWEPVVVQQYQDLTGN